MAQWPEYVDRNRKAWGKLSTQFAEPGRKSWSTQDITWGIWDMPEQELHALGDLESWRGKDAIELGCGTAYFSAWLAKLGMKPVGIDITPEQLANARLFQQEFGIEFPLIEGSAEDVPFPDGSFDLALSEYGASIWCDPYKWIPEAARLLRPGGKLVFLRNSPISQMCTPDVGPAEERLCRDWFGMFRLEWPGDESVEFCLPTGPMLRLLRANGFEIEDLIEIQVPEDGRETRFDYITKEWARRWPSEEIWVARKRS
jgi:ubiquinone/menaquinone biosynthesis C-methylase UbiE